MKPIQNIRHRGYFQAGDMVERHKGLYTGVIDSLVLCRDGVEHCRNHYKNFHVCGGFRRIISGWHVCMFVRRSDEWLTDRPGGGILL